MDFVWWPEGLPEADAGLLGDVARPRRARDRAAAPASARAGCATTAEAVALDLSGGMLDTAAADATVTGVSVPLVRADGHALPFPDASFDLVFTAFGALPFVADSGAVMPRPARVLRPGGRCVFSITHPMRWIFLRPDPGEPGLRPQSYFDRTPYVEGRRVRAGGLRGAPPTLGDRVRELVAAGLSVVDLVEPGVAGGEPRDLGRLVPKLRAAGSSVPPSSSAAATEGSPEL